MNARKTQLLYKHFIICSKAVEPMLRKLFLHLQMDPHQLNFTSQTIPDCIGCIIGVFCYNFKSQMNILVHINTLAYVKAEI